MNGPAKEVTKEEFEASLKEFFSWSGGRARSKSAWYSSLEEWTGYKFKEAYEIDHPKVKT